MTVLHIGMTVHDFFGDVVVWMSAPPLTPAGIRSIAIPDYKSVLYCSVLYRSLLQRYFISAIPYFTAETPNE
jgi:hypothetical protein